MVWTYQSRMQEGEPPGLAPRRLPRCCRSPYAGTSSFWSWASSAAAALAALVMATVTKRREAATSPASISDGRPERAWLRPLFPVAALQPARDEHPGSGGERLGHVHGDASPGVHVEEVGLLDRLAVAVDVEPVDRDAELDDGLAGRGVAELGIPGEVPNDGDGVQGSAPSSFPSSSSLSARLQPGIREGQLDARQGGAPRGAQVRRLVKRRPKT